MMDRSDSTTFKVWKPINGLPKTLVTRTIFDGGRRVQVVLENHDFLPKVVTLNCSEVLTYRYIDGHNYLKSSVPDYSTWSLFTAENSEYLKWFLEEACGIYDETDVIHVRIINEDEIFDLICKILPEVMWSTIENAKEE